VDLEATAQRRLGRLVVRVAQDPAPAQRVDDERRVDVAAVGEHAGLGAPLDLRRHEPRVVLVVEQPAEGPVVERGPAPRQPVADAPVRRGEAHARQLLADRVADVHRVQPRRRRGARGRRALPHLVAVDHEHVGAAAGELARDGEPGERRAADEDVGALAVERRALGAPRGRAARHALNTEPAISHGASVVRRRTTS
jgi:hypothetical protein